MKTKQTDRGFNRADFTDANGERCSVQESSAWREEALIWLGIDDVKPLLLTPGKGWQEIPLPEDTMSAGRMHLTQSQVRDLLPILQRFAVTGRLIARKDKK